MRRGSLVLLAVACLALVPGCRSGPRPRPVRGTVSYKNQPIDNGTITFLSTGERRIPMGGALIREGRYEVPADKGLLPGIYAVVISWPGPPAAPTPEERAAGASARASQQLPKRYNDETTLTVTVQDNDTATYDFPLN